MFLRRVRRWRGIRVLAAIAALLQIASFAGLGPSQLWPSIKSVDNPPAFASLEDGRHLGISDPVEITLRFSDAPEIGKTLEARAEVTSRWADLQDVRIAIRTPHQVSALSKAWSVGDLPLDASTWATFPLTPRQGGLFQISVQVTGSSDLFGRLGGYTQAFLEVPSSGSGQVHLGSPPTPVSAQAAVEVAFSADRVQGPRRDSPMTPKVATGTPLPLPEGFGGSETGGPGVGPESHSFFIVTGRWMYTLEDDATLAPQRWANVQVWDDDLLDPDDLLWEGLTDSNGQFTSANVPRVEEWPKGNQDVYVRFLTCNGAVCVTTSLGSTYSWVTNPVTLGSEDTFDVGTLTAGASQFAQRPFEYVNNGWDYAVNRGGLGSVLGQVRVSIPDSCTFYTLLTDTIHLCADGVDDKSPDDVNHEYGHYVQDKLFNDVFWPSPGGVHYLCEDNQNRGLSWTEGFADFFGPRANHDIVDSTDVFYTRPWDGSLFSIDMESADRCPSSVQGDDHEMRVAWSLWDLADSTDDGSLDQGIGHSASTILDAINDCNQSTYRAFYDGGLCNWVSRGNPRYDLLATGFQNTIDYNDPPSVSVTSQAAFSWVSGTILLEASASDPDTPVSLVQFRLSLDAVCSVTDGFAGDDTASPFSFPFDTASLSDTASLWICAQSSDNMETSLWAISGSSIGVDNAAPSSTPTLSGLPGASGWYLSDVSVSLSATDALSGVAEIWVRLDGGAWQTYAGSVVVAGDGVHTVQYYATDVAGNTEPVQSLLVNVDKLAAQTSADLQGTSGAGGWYRSPVNVTLNAIDPTSGVGIVSYRIDGGPWQTYTGPVAVTGDGVYTVEYYATDVAGNTEAVRGLQLSIDTVAPLTSADLSGTLGAGGWYRSPVNVTLNAIDPTSGVGSVSYRIDGGPWQLFGTRFLVSGDGVHQLEISAIDLAGNLEAARTVELRIDGTSPSFTYIEPTGIITTAEVQVRWDATDDTSGLARYEVSVNEGEFQSVGSSTSAVFVLGEGEQRVRVRAIDYAGNVMTEELAFRVDTNIFSITGPYTGIPLYALIAGIAALAVFAMVRRKWRGKEDRDEEGEEGSVEESEPELIEVK